MEATQNLQSPKQNNENGSQFNISLDKKTNKWLWIIFIVLLLVLLLKVTGLATILITSIIILIPFAIAFSIAILLNPLIQRLVKRGINQKVAKYGTFVLFFTVGIIIIIVLLWLIINQFWELIERLLGDSNTVKYLLDQFHDPKDKAKILLSNIFGFRYDNLTDSFILNTNIEWDDLKKNWIEILNKIWAAAKTNSPETLSKLLADLQQNFGISWSSLTFELDYIQFLKDKHSITNFEQYFTNLYNYIINYVRQNNLQVSNLEMVNLSVIADKIQGIKIDSGLGAIYHLIFKLSDLLGSFLSTKIAYNAIDTIHSYTNSTRITKVFLTKYLIILAIILYSIILTIILAVALSNQQQKISYFIKTKILPGKTLANKEKVGFAFKRSLIGYSKGIAIDMSYMFICNLIVMVIAGFAAGGSSYKSSFVILALFMTFCNLVPYIGPFIGIIPIAVVGILDAVTHSNDSNPILPWVPLIIGLVGAFLIQIIENVLVYPKVFGKVTQLHPATILVGISVFGAIFGIAGMVLAVPVIATYKAVANDVYNKNYQF